MNRRSKALLELEIWKKLNRSRSRKREEKAQPFQGRWKIWSNKDSRWNADGTSETGGDRRPEEMNEKVKELQKKYGTPPDDLEFKYNIE